MRSRNLKIAIAIFALFSFAFSAKTYSRYSSAVSGSDSARAAEVVTELFPVSAALNGTPIAPVSGGISLEGMKAGDTLVFDFEVRNFSGAVVSMVKMNYTVGVVFSPEVLTIPLEYTLTRAGAPQSSGTLGSGLPEAHSYTLTVYWDPSLPGYSNLSQSIELELISTQADS